MLHWYLYVKNWLKDQEGQDLVEYGLLLGLIALGSVAAITATGGSIAGIWTAIQTAAANAAAAT